MVSCPRLRPLRPSAGGPFIVVATMVLQRFPSLGLKSRIEAVASPFCRRNHSSLRQRKLESDAEDRCSHGSYRQNHSSLQLRKLESDAEDRCRYEISRRNHSPLHRFASLALKSRIDARKRVKTGKSLQRFASLGLKSRIDARMRA